LNPLLDEFRAGAVINHHTPKVTNRDTSNWRGSDWMYAGAGSADITNWCRAAVVIDPTYTQGVFKFILAKRGSRIFWFDPAGGRVFFKYFRHAADGRICWELATQEDIEKAGASLRKSSSRILTEGEVIELIPEEGSIAKNQLVSLCRTNGASNLGARDLVQRMIEDGRIHEWRVPRPGTNPERRVALHPQPQQDPVERQSRMKKPKAVQARSSKRATKKKRSRNQK
jgi:hypothetical protein